MTTLTYEYKCLIQTHEADEATHEPRRLAEIEAIVKQRIADAVSETRSAAVNRAVQLVNLVRELPQLLNQASADADNGAVSTFHDAIHGGDEEKLHTAVGLFIAGQGDCEPSPFFNYCLG